MGLRSTMRTPKVRTDGRRGIQFGCLVVWLFGCVPRCGHAMCTCDNECVSVSVPVCRCLRVTRATRVSPKVLWGAHHVISVAFCVSDKRTLSLGRDYRDALPLHGSIRCRPPSGVRCVVRDRYGYRGSNLLSQMHMLM